MRVIILVVAILAIHVPAVSQLRLSDYIKDPGAIYPQLIRVEEAMEIRRRGKVMEWGGKRGSAGDALKIIGKRGGVPSNVSKLLLKLQKRDRAKRRAAKRRSPRIAMLTKDRALHLFIAQCEDLIRELDGLEYAYDLGDSSDRREAAGSLILHVWSFRGVEIPAPAEKLWKHLEATVDKKLLTLKPGLNPAQIKKRGESASQHMKQTKKLRDEAFLAVAALEKLRLAEEARLEKRLKELREGKGEGKTQGFSA